MNSTDEKTIKLQLRANRIKRKELKQQREELKATAQQLREERASLINKAKSLGIQIGKKASSVQNAAA